MPIIKQKPRGGDIGLSPDKAPDTARYSDPAMTLPKTDDGQRAAKYPNDATNHRYVRAAAMRKRASILIGNKSAVFAVTLAAVLLLTNTIIRASPFSEVKKPTEAGNYGGASAALAEEVNPVTVSPLAGRNTIAAGVEHTVSQRSDGTVVAAGGNYEGQCDVSGWVSILLPGNSKPSFTAGNQSDADMESGEAGNNGEADQQQLDDAYPAEPTPEPYYEPAAEETGEFVIEFIAEATQAPTSAPAAVEPEEEVILPQPVVEQTDAEAQLRARLQEQTGEEPFMFFCADYDGNGTHEAFALLGGRDDWGLYSGDIWFVNANGATCVQQGLSYLKLEMLGNSPTMIFHAEENYGGSGSTSHTWMVEGDQPKKVEAQVAGDLEWAGGNDYYGFPSAFDMDDDGTGHTWKRYYFYMDNGTLREYGGINISLDELLEFDGAAELIDAKIEEGYSVGSIIYRANGVINVNLDRGSQNANLSLRYDDTSVQYWEEDGGVYLTASDPSIAVYPEGFRHPSDSGASSDVPGNQQAVKPTQGEQSGDPASGVNGYNCAFDLDGDGTQENLLLYARHSPAGSSSLRISVYLKVTRVDGSVLGECQINDYEVWIGDTNEGPDCRYLIYNLGDDRLFIHQQFSMEGIADDYIIIHMESGTLTEEMHVRDPDMSDACGIYDDLTGGEIYYSWTYDDKVGSAYMNSLNSFTAPYGLSFHVEGDHACVDLPDSQLICVATALQIDPDGPVPYDYLDFANLDVAPYVDEGSAADSSWIFSPEVIEASGESDESDESESQVFSAYTTGDVNLRSGPGLNYASIATIPGGSYVDYLNEEAVDDRGVTWYHVSWAGKDGWGSSKYVVIE